MEKMKYQISSRATILLGRESVSKADGAIIELIKNTYDADASFCYICFDNEYDNIYIIDNGVGMTKEVIENHWMLIGTDNKKQNFKSNKNRIKSGEKGIGRFALDRLGSKCEMFTKNKNSNLIYWKNDWKNFEQPGRKLDEIEAEFEYLDCEFKEVLPDFIYKNIKKIQKYKIKNFADETFFCFDTGTILKISNLRDNWGEKDILNIIDTMGYLLPPSEEREYIIFVQKNRNEEGNFIENEITEEFDYKLSSKFDGDYFYITLNRNEFDLNKIPNDLFKDERLAKFPYRKEDFEKGIFNYKYSIAELINSDDENYLKEIKKIGPFSFKYIFMKLSLQDDSKETFFYKEISKKRKIWLGQHGGIKIYRDNFLVRPYGNPNDDMFDWLGLDARRATNPAAVSDARENWHVRNAQGQGSVFISRVANSTILDKSNREGIIENDYFKFLKFVIVALIGVFEKDRAYIARTMKMYFDKKNEKELAKENGKNIAKEILNNKRTLNNNEQVNVLAKAVKFYEEEREELMNEIQSLRSLATNGLITTAIVHDLKGIEANLLNRIKTLKITIKNKDEKLINKKLEALEKDDKFLKAWITIITSQAKKDKRKRIKKDLYAVIEGIISLLKPIVEQKKIDISFTTDKNKVEKRIFISDFESIVYNLVINSIESFEKSKLNKRIIEISLETKNENLIFHYKDNGKGLGKIFKNPYDIFKYGVTSKRDLNGNIIGTGLGMYIVASTLREYNSNYKLIEWETSFALDLIIPI